MADSAPKRVKIESAEEDTITMAATPPKKVKIEPAEETCKVSLKSYLTLQYPITFI